MKNLSVDFSRIIGKIKPLHGVNNSPVTYGDALPAFSEAGIPYVRTHDTAGAYGGTHFIDVPNIFPDFEADPENPASYDFAFTDAYLKGLTASGCQIFYRLGVTIENYWRIKAYRIHPPKDFGKWARICAGIIRHYNEGWADGFHYGIEYWEIWNEPENPPMWTGTREEFFELYRTAAVYLKKEFPALKFGGYASCGFYAITDEKCSDFYKSFVTWYEEFLKFVTANGIPLDFFSWHLYTADLDQLIAHAEYVTAKLREYGLDHVENIFNEWNYINHKEKYVFDALKEIPGAVFVAGAFCRMQNSVVDKAMYYDALPSRSYCGLYYFPSMRLTKTYYAFKAFNELYKLGNQVYCSSEAGSKVLALAAAGDGLGTVLLVNSGRRKQEFALQLPEGYSVAGVLLLGRDHDLEEVDGYCARGRVTVPAMSVMVLECTTGVKKKKTVKKQAVAAESTPHVHAGLQELKKKRGMKR